MERCALSRIAAFRQLDTSAAVFASAAGGLCESCQRPNRRPYMARFPVYNVDPKRLIFPSPSMLCKSYLFPLDPSLAFCHHRAAPISRSSCMALTDQILGVMSTSSWLYLVRVASRHSVICYPSSIHKVSPEAVEGTYVAHTSSRPPPSPCLSFHFRFSHCLASILS